MADLFDDKNLFGDSFDLLQSGENNLFADDASKKQTAGTPPTAQKVETKPVDNVNQSFGFDDNLFANSDGLGGGNLFDTAPEQSSQNALFDTKPESKTQQEFVEQQPTNQNDFGFDNNLFEASDGLFDGVNNQGLNDGGLQETYVEQEVIPSDEQFAQENQTEEQQPQPTKPVKEKKKKTKSRDLSKKEKQNPKSGEAKSNIFKNKKFVIIASVALAVVVAVIIAVVAIAGGSVEKFNTPNFMVYQRDSGTVLIIDSQENAQGYEVVVTQNGTNQTQFTSASNTVELKLYLNEPGVYNVKVRVLGKSAGEHSSFSEAKSITNYVKLQAPEVFRNGNTLSWNAVNGAVSYNVYYRANVESDVVEHKVVAAGPEVLQFDLTQLNEFGAGLYPVCVESIASGEYRLNSTYSRVFNYEYYSNLDSPMAAVYDEDLHELSFVVYKERTKADRYMLTVSLNNGSSLANHYIYVDELESSEIVHESKEAILYKASLSELLSGEPGSLTLKAVGDGVYATDSLAVDVLVV